MVKVLVEESEQPLETTVEQDIRRFEEWFQAKGNDPLVRSEVAILKTYLFYKSQVEPTA